MKMNDYINDFTTHLKEGIEIANKSVFKSKRKNFNAVLICGLGGSGIGGSIIKDVLSAKTTIPIIITKDYSIPNFVNNNTLVIASSYSGNTEETISALQKCQQKGAEIAIITSGGELETIAKNKNYNNIIIPGGSPPRAMFGYAFVQLFYVLNHYEIISDFFMLDLKQAIRLLDREKPNIQKQAIALAKNLIHTTPIIYVANGFEGVAVRFRQQINENSKMLCWHHVIPEMNHNELLGWRTNVENLSVVFLRNQGDYKKNQIRMNINKEVISKYTTKIFEIWSKGDSVIENSLYHINFGDWVSWYLSELNNVNAIEIDVINFLKKELSKIK